MENRKVFLNKHTNLLELEEHMYPLVDVDTPNVFRNLFHYDEIPKIAFNDRIVPHNMPDEYGSQTQHSEMVSSRELHIRLNRLFRFMNICTDSAARKEKYGRANSFYTVKKTEMLSIAAWKKGMNFRRLRVGSEQAKKILSL